MPDKLAELSDALVQLTILEEDKNTIAQFEGYLFELEREMAKDPENERLCNMVIQALYFAPVALPERKERIETAIKNFLPRFPSNFWMRYHYGCYLFDEKEYQKSLDEFYQLPNPGLYLIAIDQKWRLIKLHEVYACIYLYLGKMEEAERQLQYLTDLLSTTHERDIPIHRELFEAIHHLKTETTFPIPLEKLLEWEKQFDFSKIKNDQTAK